MPPVPPFVTATVCCVGAAPVRTALKLIVVAPSAMAGTPVTSNATVTVRGLFTAFVDDTATVAV